jgi:hypothetical protein
MVSTPPTSPAGPLAAVKSKSTPIRGPPVPGLTWSTTHTSRYTATQAAARKISGKSYHHPSTAAPAYPESLTDIGLIESITDAYRSNVFIGEHAVYFIKSSKFSLAIEQPSLHPAYDCEKLATTPDALKCHHPDTSTAILFTAPNTYKTSIAVAIADLNATTGIPLETMTLLVQQSITCLVCECAFSIEGFNRHRINENACGNTPDGDYSKSITFLCLCYTERYTFTVYGLDNLYEVVPPLLQRTYLAGVLPIQRDLLHTASGFAWLSWNSRDGVTRDAWALTSTGWQYCEHCQLVRTFVAHRAHCEKDGNCLDPGEDLVGRIAAGDDSD